MQRSLNAVTSETHRKMEDVHARRVQYGADIVILIIDHSAYCGMAWLGPRKDLMFSVTAHNWPQGILPVATGSRTTLAAITTSEPKEHVELVTAITDTAIRMER